VDHGFFNASYTLGRCCNQVCQPLHTGLGLAAATAAVRCAPVDAAGSHDVETSGPTPAPCLRYARSRGRRRRTPGARVFVGPFVRSSSATQQVCPPLLFPLCFVNLYSDLI
jgi:hypothetical protein